MYWKERILWSGDGVVGPLRWLFTPKPLSLPCLSLSFLLCLRFPLSMLQGGAVYLPSSVKFHWLIQKKGAKIKKLNNFWVDLLLLLLLQTYYWRHSATCTCRQGSSAAYHKAPALVSNSTATSSLCAAQKWGKQKRRIDVRKRKRERKRKRKRERETESQRERVTWDKKHCTDVFAISPLRSHRSCMYIYNLIVA